MPPPFDPYHRWLSIPPHDRPLNHYRLLGLPLFENDAEVIRDAAERQLGHLRRYLAGAASALAQHLIAEVTRAHEELLNPTAKQSYDSQLHTRNPFETGFLVREGFEQSVGVTPDLMARLMGHGFDALHHWLGIPAREQPPTLYRLLGLQPFEADLDVIREGAERQIAHIRKYSLGERRAIAETLLRVLAEARGQLLDGVRKQAYDQRLSQLGSLVRRYASGAIEAPSDVPQETEPPVPLEAVSGADAAPAALQIEDFEAIPLPPVQSLPPPARRRQVRPWPAWPPYAAGGCVVVAFLFVLLIAALQFINRRGPAIVGVSPPRSPVDTSSAPTPNNPGSASPAISENTNRTHLEPPRNGNPRLDYHRLVLRLDEVGIDVVIEEYHRDASDPDVALVAAALDLSKHILRQDKSQLWSQLQARTVEAGGVPLSNFQQARPTTPHWECLTPSLAQAGGPLLRIIKGKDRLDTLREPLAFTPDGTKLVGLSAPKTIKVWELATGKEISSFAGHPAWVKAVAATPDGETVVSASLGSGSGDNTLKIWKLASGRELHSLAGHDTSVYVVAIAPDGRSAVSGSDDRTVAGPPAETLKVWDIETGRELRTLPGLGKKIKAVMVTPDGQQVVAMSFDALQVWDLATGAEQHTLRHRSTIPALAVSRDSRLVAATSTGNAIQVWDLKSGSEVQTLTGHQGLARAIAFTDDSSQLVTSSLDETVKVWDLQTGTATKTFSGHDNMASAIAISPDAQTVVSAAKGHKLLLSSVPRGSGPITFAHNSYVTTAVAFAPDNQTVVTATNNSLCIWNTLARETSIRLPEFVPSGPVAIRPDGSIIAYSPADPEGYGANDTTIRIWNMRSSSVTSTLVGHEKYVVGLAFSHDGRRLRSTDRGGADKYWDVATGAELPGTTAAAFPGDVPSGHEYEVVAREGALLTVQDRTTPEPQIEMTIPGDHTFAAATLVVDQQTIIAVDHSGAIHQFRVFGLGEQR